MCFVQDFRSENGLYSLIQAQFDAANRQIAEKNKADGEETESEAADNDATGESKPAEAENDETSNDAKTDATSDEPAAQLPKPSEAFMTPRQNRRPLSVAQLTTSPLSSPPPDDMLVPPSTFRFARRLTDVAFPLSSSPLSSPPPVLFDPFMPSSPSESGSSSRRSSTTASEVDDTPPGRMPFPSSQNSASGGRSTLPNMKGKDLFDVGIWSDPLRTSVFYTFATSLRQKIKDAEPTGSHRFISHLRDRGKLVRCYTQNIDQIEEKVGLSTSLLDGPGARGRFSRRSTANANQLNKMVEEAAKDGDAKNADTTENASESIPASQASSGDGADTPQTEGESSSAEQSKPAVPTLKKEPSRSGVECVFLHGSLELLRCFLCGRVCSWEDDEREMETLSGQQPECPHCLGATAAREERGKRALGIGKLRPDIVLYGEEHPNAHLISPIVTHDLALYPDMLLILGTSLRVHGLKVMVREFAKTVHSRGGKVIFVNFTKPPESIWGDIIDFWVQWDCDAWVSDLQERIPKLWQAPEPKKPRAPAANPVALRDTRVTGAYCTSKVLKELRRLSGRELPEPPAARRATISASSAPPEAASTEGPQKPAVKPSRPRAKGPRKSAPGALEKGKQPSSTLNPNHGRARKSSAQVQVPPTPSQESSDSTEGSLLDSIKSNPRVRKRKVIDGEEVVMPTAGRRRCDSNTRIRGKSEEGSVRLPPLRPGPASSPYNKPPAMEPKSPPAGPLASLSVNLRSAGPVHRPNAFYLQDPLVNLMDKAHDGKLPSVRSHAEQENQRRTRQKRTEADAAAMALRDADTSPLLQRAAIQRTQPAAQRGFEGQLRSWGSNWNCPR